MSISKTNRLIAMSLLLLFFKFKMKKIKMQVRKITLEGAVFYYLSFPTALDSNCFKTFASKNKKIGLIRGLFGKNHRAAGEGFYYTYNLQNMISFICRNKQ